MLPQSMVFAQDSLILHAGMLSLEILILTSEPLYLVFNSSVIGLESFELSP